jgi:hypothetical protein
MGDADGGRISDEAAIWSSQSFPGFERQPASWPLPLRRALAERFPANIDAAASLRSSTGAAVTRERNMR